jgi:hypothetical protein
MSEAPADYNFYNTIYRNDVSRWGGQTYKRPENISREIDIRRASTESSTVSRCLESLRAGYRPVATPHTLYQDSYVPHVPYKRGISTSYTRRCPASPALPDAPDPSVLRPTTEYSSRYAVPRPEPFLRPELVDRCSTARFTTRTIGNDGRYNPSWDTSYRRDYCERVTQPHTTQAVTFHSYTGMR